MERNVDLLKSQFDIDREPFSDTGITGLFYPGAGRQALLEQLQHLVRYGSPLLFLLGAKGSGKTLLARQLCRQLDAGIFTHVEIEASVLMDDRSLMSCICEGFNLQLDVKKETFVSALVRYAAESDSYSQTALVVVDNVQNLSAAAIDVIADVASAIKDKGLRFLLLLDGEEVGQEAVLAPLVVDIESLGQVLTVPPLDTSDVADYLSYRMRTAGLDGVRFSPQQVKQIAIESEGVISRINQFARETLVRQIPVTAKEDSPKKALPLGRLALLLVMVVGVLLLIIGRGQDDSEVALAGGGELPIQVRGNAVKPVLSEAQVLEPDLNSIQGELDGEGYGAENLNAVDVAAVDVENTGLEGIDSEGIGSEGLGSEGIDLNYSEVAKAHVGEAVAVNNKRIIVGEAVVNEPLVSETNYATVSTQRPAVDIEASLLDYTAREQWLLSLNPEQYTLQMIGARDEPAVQDFISQYPSLKQVAYYRTLYKGKDWFVVVFGQFSSKIEAKQATASLPKKLVASKPWIRPLSQVQADIRKGR